MFDLRYTTKPLENKHMYICFVQFRRSASTLGTLILSAIVVPAFLHPDGVMHLHIPNILLIWVNPNLINMLAS